MPTAEDIANGFYDISKSWSSKESQKEAADRDEKVKKYATEQETARKWWGNKPSAFYTGDKYRGGKV